MVVVADASPLIFLGRLGLLDLLPDLYDRVLLPDEVFQEICAGDDDPPEAQWARDTPSIEVVSLGGHTTLQEALREELDPGEAAAIALALEVGADLLLVDERQGRRIARRLGLAVKGTLGVLTTARRKGLLPELKPVLERLAAEGAWLAPDLIEAALRSVGEEN